MTFDFINTSSLVTFSFFKIRLMHQQHEGFASDFDSIVLRHVHPVALVYILQVGRRTDINSPLSPLESGLKVAMSVNCRSLIVNCFTTLSHLS